MEHLIYAIDLGSKTISIVAAQYDDKEAFGIKVFACESTQSIGIRRGCITDVNATTRVINALIQGIEKRLKKSNTNRFYCVSISGLGFDCDSSKFDINIAGISSINDIHIHQLEDVAKSKYYNPSDNKMVIRQNIKSYDIDVTCDIDSPKGYSGNRLIGNFLFTLAQKSVIDNAKQIIKNQSPNLYPLASAKANILLSPEEKKNGVMLLDLGAQTTSLAIFRKDKLIYEASIPFGGDAITNDIAKGFGYSLEDAENCKRAIGMGFDLENDIETTDGKKIRIDLYRFIVSARVEEIKAYIDSEIEKSHCRHNIHKIVLTGGGAYLIGIEKYLTNEFNIPTIKAETHYERDDKEVQQIAGALGMASLFARENKDIFISNTNLFSGQLETPSEPNTENQNNNDNNNSSNDNNDKKSADSKKRNFFGFLKDTVMGNDGDKQFDE